MSVQPENHFRCNRCGDDTYVTIANTPTRSAPPEGWMTMKLDDDDPSKARPAYHFCPPCAFGLRAYMEGATISTKSADQAVDP